MKQLMIILTVLCLAGLHAGQAQNNAQQILQDFGDLKSEMSMIWKEVQKQLSSDEAAIEFVQLNLAEKNQIDTILFAALVLRPGMEAPVWIPLFELKQLESILQATMFHTQIRIEKLYVEKGKQLYQLVWQALEKELSNVKTVYYSTTGLLSTIALNALPTDNENMLLSDRYNLHLLSSIGKIARLKNETAHFFLKDTIVIYGGLTYNSPQSKMIETEKRNFAEWRYLAGTKTEAEQIISLMENNRIPCKYYTQDQGNEESFKQLSGTNAEVIHLATHCFFLPDIENNAFAEIIQRLGGDKENLLLRSGLIMSGANDLWLNREEIHKEDGILTGDEISRLNLAKTKLAILSANESGLGYIKGYEGIFGFQRAFKLAGVESLIMSLWAVPDSQTTELMVLFYKEWLSGQSRLNAFKAAQQKVREKYESPYYWAAFVMLD